MLRRFLSSAVSVAMLGALTIGCERSDLDPNADVVVQGSVLASNGAASPGMKVALVRIPDAGELLGELLVIGLSAGFAALNCLGDDPSLRICEDAQIVEVDANGAYSFALKGSDTQGTFDVPVTFNVVAKGATPAGAVDAASLEASFIINQEELRLPELRLWEPSLDVTAQGDDFRVSWSSLNEDVGAAAQDHFVSLETANAGSAWQSPGVTADEVLWRDSDVEDYAGTLTLSARRTVPNDDVGLFERHRAPTRTWTPGDRVPVSRGKTCSAQRDSAEAPLDDGDGGPCPLTDGDLAKRYGPIGACDPPEGEEVEGDEQGDPAPPPTCTQTNDTFIVVDLGAVETISRVVLRQSSVGAPIAIEVAALDGVFAQVATIEDAGPFVSVELPAATAAAKVRLRSLDDTKQLPGIAELSIF